MKAVYAIVLVFALLLGANAAPNPNEINKSVLEHRLRLFLKPGFRTEFEDNLKRFIDTFVRDLIINGKPELGIPSGDPLKVDRLDIDLNQDGLVLKGTVENVVITGASTFKVENVKADLTTLSTEIDISLAAAKLVGEHYVLEGDILNGALPVFGEGRFEVELFQSTLKVKFELGVKNDGFVELKDLELDVSVGSAKANFENLLGGGLLGDIANDFISSELPSLVDANKGPILEELVPLIKNLINENVGDLTLDELLDLVNNTP